MNNLQGIIGTSMNNLNITVLHDSKNHELHVYHGWSLFEVVPDKKNVVQHKFLAARLYNAGVKASVLNRHFGYCYRSIKKWAGAIAKGDIEEMVKALEGQGAPRKFTPEIEVFASYEFKRIYPVNKHSYSKEIRANIHEVFGVKLAPETLRPLFKRLKGEYQQASGKRLKKK